MTWKYGYGDSNGYATKKRTMLSSKTATQTGQDPSDEIRLRPVADATTSTNVLADSMHNWDHESVSSTTRAKITMSRTWEIDERDAA